MHGSLSNELGPLIARGALALVALDAFESHPVAERLPMSCSTRYYASLLIRHGESVKVVQSRLRHASAAETLDTYSHLWSDSEDRTRQAVESVLGIAAWPDADAVESPATR